MINSLIIKRWPAFLLGMISAVLLGAVSAVMFSLIGPMVQIAANSDMVDVDLQVLVGFRLAEIIQQLFGQIEFHREDVISSFPLLMISLAFLRMLFSIFNWGLWESLSEDLAAQLRARLVGSYLNLTYTQREQLVGIEEELAATATNDVRQVREYIVRFYGSIPRELLQVFSYLSVLFFISPQLFSVLFLVGIPVGYCLGLLSRKVKKRAIRVLLGFSEVSEHILQRLLGLETIKAMHRETEEVQLVRQFANRLYLKTMKVMRAKSIVPVSAEFFMMALVSCLILIAYSYIESGQSTPAVMFSFLSTAAVLAQSSGKLSKYLVANREGSAAQVRVSEVLQSLKLDSASGLVANNGDGFSGVRHREMVSSSLMQFQRSPLVQFKSVTFRFEASLTPVFENLSLKVMPGIFYALVGPSGAGKSTFAKLVLGLYTPTFGELIFSEGEPSLGRSRHIGFFPQEAPTFPGSIAENIAYPDKPDLKRIEKVLRAVGLSRELASSGRSPESVIGDSGYDLSGGQEQRIQLARLLYHPYRLIVIDEGTSGLDGENEQDIYQQLRKLVDDFGVAVISITHRIRNVSYTDRVLELKDGGLREHPSSVGYLSDLV